MEYYNNIQAVTYEEVSNIISFACLKKQAQRGKFNDVTGFCKLRNLVTRKEIEFAGVSQLLNYCRQNDIEVAIEDCIVSNVKNY
ncbi:MAG: hypothetical protein IJR03_00040 [Bacteroidales bacterium]|nr:hypothetical protein [Bacteroidales bacterium]